MDNIDSKKRKKIKYIKPNELFIKWLEEWYIETATKGSKLQYAFGKALVSLKRYPLPLKSGKECLILEHFGPNICMKLDLKLSEYKKENPNSFPIEEESEQDEELEVEDYTKIKKNINDIKKLSPKKNNKQSPKKLIKSSSYIPPKNSPAFAIFVAMYENGLECSISDKQLKIVVKRIINKIYPESCIDNLIQRNLIEENKNSDIYKLTKDGIKIAEIVYAKYILNKNYQSNQQNHNNEIQKSNEKMYGVTGEGGTWSSSRKIEVIPSYNSRLIDFDIIPLGSENKINKTNIKSEIINLDSDENEEEDEPKIKKINEEEIGIFSKKYENENSQSSSGVYSGNSQTNSEINYKNNPKSIESNGISCTSSSINSPYKETYNQNSNTDNQIIEETICMLPNTFEIYLIVDNHEIGKCFTVQTNTEDELKKLNVKYIVRSLKIGDFTWIARDKYGNELILPYIIERKRMDDFAQSIKDKRFIEQKFRLKKSGIPNLIYLVENYGSNMFLGLPLTSVLQAATNTEIIDNFNVKYTKNHLDSIKYLYLMTNYLNNIYISKTLISTSNKYEITQNISDNIINLITFQLLNKNSNKCKNFKIKEMFIKQLIQLHGLSLNKSLIIVENYSTPKKLCENFHKYGENLLTNLKYTEIGTKIGNVISKNLYMFYTRQSFS